MTKRLLPVIPDGLCVEHVLPEPDRIIILVRARRPSALCPRCHAPSSRVHILYGLITTAKLNGVDPQAWLADVLARIADLPQSRLPELLPWNWKPA
ncbi:hypothetical protein J2851_002775 [Azospirillum rugosum]|uniref:Transposase IS66 C-terminal domain-containing protein n=1 Tax=Azospirillum rugosum TaxID=416170 RepID=A0ABS4SKA9_9PROT|nr:hypothetical protein [Azospirillum rugosum]MDQ0526542.1 hypothetical protein [Azospirillum rugosum]